MPSGVKMFPAYLRSAGYYTTNHSKEDYNAVKTSDVWDDSSRKASWKNRPSEDSPFFHVETIALTHESSLHFPPQQLQTETQNDPAKIKLQPYFPDTPLFRYTRARYHDRMQQVDEKIAGILNDLKAAEQLENTFIFYFGDHGGVLPRSKGYVYESGLHVPLVVRIPQRYQDSVDRDLGSRTDGFVEFVDFSATTLNLAGAKIPKKIDGRAFLGSGVEANEVDQRDETFGYADRFDEKYDLVRTLRVGKWKYMRNFEPFYPDAMQNNYRYKMLAYEEWRDLYLAGSLDDVASAFFQPKSAEALYDLEADPHEVNNLAGNPDYADTLVQLRNRLSDRLKEMPDLSFVTEAYLNESAMNDPAAFGRRNKEQIQHLIDTANIALLPWKEAKPEIQLALEDPDDLVRYWAVVAATSFGPQATSIAPEIKRLLIDIEPLVVMRAVEFFAQIQSLTPEEDERAKANAAVAPLASMYRSFQRATSAAEGLRLMNTAVYLNDHCGDQFDIDPTKISFLFKINPKGEIQRRLDYFGALAE